MAVRLFAPSEQDSRYDASANPMSDKPDSDDEMRAESDFSRGVRNRYADRLKSGSNVVVLEPDMTA